MTANANNLALERGEIRPCLTCAVAKARQKMCQRSIYNAQKYQERDFCIDISSPKTKGFEGYQNWLLCVDDCTDMPFSFFIGEKSQLEEVLEPFFVDLKNTYGMRQRGRKEVI